MYYFPPRPEKAIPVDMIPYYEGKGFFCQLKKNGTCNITIIDKKGVPTFWNRHKELHRAWTAPENIIEYFSQFPDSVIVGELLHNKHQSVKNTIYIFDVLVHKGNDLVGMTLDDRLKIIHSFPEAKGIMIAETYTENFVELFESLTDEIDEGLVFKNPKSRLKPCFKDGLNSGWQVKARKPHKNYSF